MNRRTFSLSLLALAAAPALAQGITDQTVLARVGSAAITRKDLAAFMSRYYAKPALEQLIGESVLRQEGARLNLSVTDAELKERAAAVKKGAGLQFDIALQNEGISEDAWRARVRNVMLAEKVRDRKWPVTDDDLVRLSVRYVRLSTEQQAKDVIREAKNNVSFELLALQRSLDPENGGLVQPNPFLRVENPQFFRLAQDAGLRAGQISREPIKSGEYWLVLKLENRLGPETLKAKERETAIAKVKLFRGNALLSTARKLYKIEYPGPMDPEVPPAAGAELAKVTPLKGTGKPETITGKALNAYMLEYVGTTALQQLVERSILDQEAARLKIGVTDAELSARTTSVRKALGATAFQAALRSEGISEDAWRSRIRYELLAEAVTSAKYPAKPEELERYTARYLKTSSRRAAEQVLQAVRRGADFARIIKQLARDPKAEGFVEPRAFLRVDRPQFFDAIKQANAQPGQMVPQPVQLGNGFYVLKVEQRLGPETLSARERTEVTRRVNLPKLAVLLDQNRKEYKVEFPVPMQKLVAEAKS